MIAVSVVMCRCANILYSKKTEQLHGGHRESIMLGDSDLIPGRSKKFSLLLFGGLANYQEYLLTRKSVNCRSELALSFRIFIYNLHEHHGHTYER